MKYNVKVVDALVQALKESQWASKASVHVCVDEFYPEREDDQAKMEIRYEVKGRVLSVEAAALGCWTPDRLMGRCDEIADEFDVTVICECDFVVEATGIKVKDLLTAEKSIPVVEMGRRNVILCWTSFHDETKDALATLSLLHSTLPSDNNRIVSLVLDEQPQDARSMVRSLKLPFETLWVGSGGWTSKAAKALSIEESSPTCFLFDKNGEYVTSGALEDALMAMEEDEHEDEISSDVEEEFEENDTKQPKAISIVVPLELWTRIKVMVATLTKQGGGSLQATLRSVTTVRPSAAGDPKVDERVNIKGEVFTEGRQQYLSMKQAILKATPSSVKVNFRSVQHCTKPNPLVFHSLCVGCSLPQQQVTRGCLCCALGLCESCGNKHDRRHPLVVLGVPRHDLTRSLYGFGHVVFSSLELNEDDGTADAHPDIGCDSCLCALTGATVRRYKNLARKEHELCEKCFRGSLDFKGSETSFTDKFSCAKNDPFCEMKSSRGVVFSRLDVSYVEPEESETIPKSNTAASKLTAEGQGGIEHIPNGHTRFSWLEGGRQREVLPYGHTALSWTGSF